MYVYNKNIILGICVFGLFIIVNVLQSQTPLQEKPNVTTKSKVNIENPLSAISQIKNADGKPPNFYQIKNAYDKYWLTKPDDENTGRKPAGWKQYKRWEHFWETRLMPDSSFPKGENILHEWNNFNANRESKKEKVQAKSWSLMGPTQIPETFSKVREQGLGRINIVRFDPQNPNVIWAGSASGGLWKSVDGGLNWETFPFTNFLSLGISDIAVYPKNPSIVYVATGDDDASYGSGAKFYSIGLIKTSYGGAIWDTTSLSNKLSDGFLTSRILIHPDDFKIVLVGTSNGIYKSTDAGKTWSNTLENVFIKDMEMITDDPNIINATSISYSGASSFYRSSDNGNTWELKYTVSGAVRIAITVSESNPNKVWAVAARDDYTSFHSFLVSDDKGLTWEPYLDYTVSPNLLGRYSGTKGDSVVGQGNYDLCIAVNPQNENEIYVGGINIWKSDDGGNSFKRLTSWVGDPYVHADQHDLIFKPGTTRLYSANDGGLTYTDDFGTNWIDITKGMSITQFYRIGQSKTNPNLVIGGCQDNGTSMFTDDGWKHLQEGDGMECAISPSNDKTMFMTYPWGELYYSTNSGYEFYKSVEKDDFGEYANWVTPFLIDEANPNIMYIGFQNVYKSTSGGTIGSWRRKNDLFGQPLISMAIAPSDNDVIYAATYYELYASYDGANTWKSIYRSSRQITYIAVDPVNPKRLWMTIGGFYANSKVMELNDTVLKDMSGNLPNVPINCIVYQKNSPDRLYVGTDIGVFYSDYNSAFWEPYGQGMPNVIVSELEIFYPAKKLRAATYGRGLWETDIMECNMSQPGITVKGLTEFCEGDSVIIEAEPGYSKYLWSNGDTNRVLAVKSTGTYSVRVYDNNDCYANSNAVFVNVLPVQEMRILNLANPAGFCEDDSLRLTAPLGFKTYLWSTGQTGRSIFVSTPGKYWVLGTANNGCERRSEEVEIVAFSNPAQAVITKEGNLITAEAEGVEITAYQWYLNGNKIANAVGMTYLITESGLYSVQITDSNGCSSLSQEYDIILGIEELNNSGFIQIYPNPADGEFNLVINNSDFANVEIEVKDILGKMIFKEKFVNPGNDNIFKIDLNSQPQGVYFAIWTIGQQRGVIKLIKK